MESRISRVLLRSLIAIAVVSLIAIGIAAQEDPDPNSPTPVLLSEVDSTRAIAIQKRDLGRVDISRFSSRPIPQYSTIVLFVTNLSLMNGEGANAFRVNAEDGEGRAYRFPVLAIEPYYGVKSDTPVYAVTVQVRDELGFWQDPPAEGDILVALTWRGITSNRVKVGLGQFGGKIKDDPGAFPTPLKSAVTAKGKGAVTRSPSPDYVGYRWAGDRMRFLEQATFGPTAALDARIRRIGLRTWLAEQFDTPYPSAANPYPSQPLMPGNAPTNCDGQNGDDVPANCFRDSYSMYQPQTWFFREAFYGDAQLRHRVAWALAEIWVTSGVDIQQGRHMVEYHKILSNNAFGNYRDLMKQMTLNPTMGDYLSMSQSTRNNPNENYAREIMQLFTVGLFMLNQDGTVQCVEHNPCQAGDTPKPTYSQDDVNNLTKVLTGWSFCEVTALCPNRTSGASNYIDPMLLNVSVTTLNGNKHDLTQKTLLALYPSTTTIIPACPVLPAAGACNATPASVGLANTLTYANNSLDQALDNLFNHPNLGPFVAKRLIQQMVTSDPTAAYVSRVAGVFNDNGFGVRGDMKAVVKAVLLDPEARGDVKTDPGYGKLREPVQLTTNLLRAFNVRSADGLSQSDGFLTGRGEFTGMAQTPFMSPTVFNFYPPDYVVPNTAFVGPEFAIMNTGTAIGRSNFMNRFVFTAIPIPVNNPNSPTGLSLDLSDLQALSTADSTGGQLVDELNRRMLHSTMSATMRTTIMNAVTTVSATDTLGRVRQAVYLVATSSQYQVQR